MKIWKIHRNILKYRWEVIAVSPVIQLTEESRHCDLQLHSTSKILYYLIYVISFHLPTKHLWCHLSSMHQPPYILLSMYIWVLSRCVSVWNLNFIIFVALSPRMVQHTQFACVKLLHDKGVTSDARENSNLK